MKWRDLLPFSNRRTSYNIDEVALLSKRIDQSQNIPILHQALRIALYDEYRAHTFYTIVIDTFAAKQPFVNIMAAEARHIESLLNLFNRYRVEPPVNYWPQRLLLPESYQECCELGVAGELENISMYDYLVGQIQEAEVIDVFFRLQAASYNNHLPAFRRCSQPATSEKLSISGETLIDAMADYLNGKGDPEQLKKLLIETARQKGSDASEKLLHLATEYLSGKRKNRQYND